MSWTKRQLLDQAFSSIAMAQWQFDLDPEDINYALNFMDAMVASWNIPIGYQQSSSPTTSDPSQVSGLALDANQAVYSNVAIGIAPKFGKSPSIMTQRTAATTYDQLLARTALVIPMQFDNTLNRGAGNKPWRGAKREYFNPINGDTAALNTELGT